MKKPIYKKWWFWVLVVFVGLPILGGILDDSPKPDEEKADEEKVETTENQFAKYEIKEDDVMNGTKTEKIGKRGYIETDINSLDEINLKDLKEFYEGNIKDNDYNWFTIFLNNNYSLVYVGGKDTVISYGKSTADGTVEEQKGIMTITDNSEKPYEYEEIN